MFFLYLNCIGSQALFYCGDPLEVFDVGMGKNYQNIKISRFFQKIIDLYIVDILIYQNIYIFSENNRYIL